MPLDVFQTEALLVAFDDEGRRDLAETNGERHATASLLDQSE